MPELGGRRTPAPDSRNTVWRNVAFRAYADFMETGAFKDAFAVIGDSVVIGSRGRLVREPRAVRAVAAVSGSRYSKPVNGA